ncbi:SusE domain-containing protein [uncultured Polaribacter sp.]|uniref:SusE domain-containing protein n=1 Tax=uncultured Polaribacter sp. TaxID=174711 RepID=UPI0030DC311F|tara:strand:+ start:15759 stop:17108 length:1350 start_codon:yes stop_codon:yes gene_type:complete
MKKYINKIVLLFAILILGTACEDNIKLTVLEVVSFDAAAEVVPSNVIVTEENENESLATAFWTSVTYPIEAPVSYKVQFDIPADTIGDNAWGKAISKAAGVDVLSKSFLGVDLNEIALSLGLLPDVEGTLVIRVESYMDRAAYSKPTVLKITPYEKNIIFGEIFVPGAYQEWNVDTAAALTTIDNGVYQGYITFPSDKGLGFKITPERNWETYYGANGDGKIEEMNDMDLAVPASGTYLITANLNNNTWSYQLSSFGLIGTATAGGWDADTDMIFDHQNKLWISNLNLQAGALKFRLNDSWDVNYGSQNSTDFIAYLGDQGAHDVSESTTFEVTFSINEDLVTANYSVNKINYGIIGDATQGGWDTSTPMIFNNGTNEWKVTADLIPGALKFRLNNEWTVNYGARNNDDGIVYLDDSGAHGITEAGTYEITFKLVPNNKGTATYIVQKI